VWVIYPRVSWSLAFLEIGGHSSLSYSQLPGEIMQNTDSAPSLMSLLRLRPHSTTPTPTRAIPREETARVGRKDVGVSASRCRCRCRGMRPLLDTSSTRQLSLIASHGQVNLQQAILCLKHHTPSTSCAFKAEEHVQAKNTPRNSY